jgi:hypothetical protein
MGASADYKIVNFELQDINQGYAFAFVKENSFCNKSLQVGLARRLSFIIFYLC